MKFRWVPFFLISCAMGTAHAEQGCPPGQYPIGGQGAMACAPIPQENRIQQQPSVPSGEWIPTWGAISMGSIDSTTSFGVITGKLSKSEAEQDSLRRCASHGEDNCKVFISYNNQCVALAEPQINGLPFATGVVSASRAGTIAEASDITVLNCKEKNKKTPQAQCKVTYTACTEQIFRKY